MSRPFYVTTPIYYPNSAPHLGSAYTTAVADTLARYHRALGDETFFLTGIDEHGEKIAAAAEAEGLPPIEFVDRMAETFKSSWLALGMTPDRFIRTTEPDHVHAVETFWQTIHDAGEIYFREYEGRYCVGCEDFKTERELVGGKCPEHDTELEIRSESNYFFRMSKQFDWLLAELETNPQLITPERYRNEVAAMVKSGGLGDLCISRPRERLEWGIPLPFDDDYVLYVWTDALINYLTAVGYPDDPAWTARWSGVHHLIGKGILKPHAVFWPTMLHVAGLPLYAGLHVHGHWNIGGRKMGKSMGNLVDALAVKDRYGFDALRYYLLRDMPFGLDGEFSEDAMVRRYNADLANDLGNLLNRTVGMAARWFDGIVPTPAGALDDLREAAATASARVADGLEQFSTRDALDALWELVSAANKAIDREAPWQLAKDPAQAEQLATVLYEALEALRVIAHLLAPFLPETAPRMLAALGDPPPRGGGGWHDELVWGGLPAGSALAPGAPLFPRVETE